MRRKIMIKEIEDIMAEAMKGLQRSHRCTELSKQKYRRNSNRYGMGSKKQK